VKLLATSHAERLARIERWLDRESYLFRDEQWWPKTLPGFFYQQPYNRSVEEEQPLKVHEPPTQWLRQMREVGVEDRSLLRIFAGHSEWVNSVAFLPDGRLAMTCDQLGRVFFWQVNGADQGKLLGLYVAAYDVGAVYCKDATHLVLADLGGPRFRPHFYYLKLEGTW
jgi:WD40 repeat protein